MARGIVKSERLLVFVVFLLAVFGLVVLASTSVPLSQQNFNESYYYFRHQLLFGFLPGLVAFFIARSLKPSFYKKFALPFFAFSIFLLGLLLIPQFGYEIGGARRWLGISSFSFQPSEIAKLGLIVYLAAWLDKRRYNIQKTSSVFQFLVIIGSLSGLIIIEPDIGTSMLIVAVGLIMYFAAGAKIKSVAAVLLIVLAAASALVLIEPYRRARVLTFLNPSGDVQGQSYQLNQSLIAIGSGGLFGRGLGHSIQKYQYLPESIGDAIFAIVAEELGFFGTAAVLITFLIFIISSLKIATRSKTIFGNLLVVGIVSWISLQTIFNIASITGLMPFTGIPLPFISYGGTALILELGAVGIIASVARHH